MTGDHGGRVVVFRDGALLPSSSDSSLEDSFEMAGGKAIQADRNWVPFFQFQSHESVFDYLRSKEVSCKVNHLKAIPASPGKLSLLSCNEKTIKAWKVGGRKRYSRSAVTLYRKGQGINLRKMTDDIDTSVHDSKSAFANLKQSYVSVHQYNIHSIDYPDYEDIFLSADDLRVNLWNIERCDASFNVVDIKPENMDNLSEVITCAKFKKQDSGTILFATSKGITRQCDLREAAFTSTFSKTYRDRSSNGDDDAYHEITQSVSDFDISKDGRYVLTRDYFSVRLWDSHMEREPVKVFDIQNYLKPIVNDLYESESLFDKFHVSFCPDDSAFTTGSYGGKFYMFDTHSEDMKMTEKTIPTTEEGNDHDSLSSDLEHSFSNMGNNASRTQSRLFRNLIDHRVLNHCFHPIHKTLVVTGMAGIYLYDWNREMTKKQI